MTTKEICGKYGIESSDLEEIRRELKRLLKEEHPDTSKDVYNEEYYISIKKDMEYIEEQIKFKSSGDIILSHKDIALILSNIVNKREVSEKSLVDYLDKSIVTQKELSHNRNKTPRYTSAGVLTMLTALWLFPEKLIEHPSIKIIFEKVNYNDFAQYSTLIWLFVLVYTWRLWLKLKRQEYIENNIINSLQLERIQNKLFDSFLEKVENSFSVNTFKKYVDSAVYRMEIKNRGGLINFFLRVRANISEDVIENVTKVILFRAKERGIIREKQSNKLDEEYEIV